MAETEQRHLWVVNHYASIPSKDERYGRHFALATHLIPQGWSTTLFVSSTTHPSGQQRMPGPGSSLRRTEDGVATVWVRVPAYAGSAIRRAWGMIVFTLRVLSRSTTAGLPAPSAVIGSTVHPLAAWAGLRLARRHRVPFIYEIRDVWPETLVDLGRLSPRGLVARTMRWFSKHLCRHASIVMSPLPGVKHYLKDLGYADRPFLWLSNGIEVEDPSDLVDVEPAQTEFSYMYLGSIGHANGVETLITAFDRAWSHDPRVRGAVLRIIGDGPLRDTLRARSVGLSSADAIRFEDRIPKHEVAERAREASCFVVNMADLPVYRYGISLNKIFDYLLAARVTIIATNAPNNPVAEANAGLTAPADDIDSIAEAMVEVRSMNPAELQQLGENGRRHVVSNYTYSILADRLRDSLDDLVEECRVR